VKVTNVAFTADALPGTRRCDAAAWHRSMHYGRMVAVTVESRE
jgi:hypothetical protein